MVFRQFGGFSISSCSFYIFTLCSKININKTITWTGFKKLLKATSNLSPSLSPLLRLANTSRGLQFLIGGGVTSRTTNRFLLRQLSTVKLIQCGGRINVLYFPKSQTFDLLRRHWSCVLSWHQTHRRSHNLGSVPHWKPHTLHELQRGKFPRTHWCFMEVLFDSTSTLQAYNLVASLMHSSWTEIPQFSQYPPRTRGRSQKLQYVGLSKISVINHRWPLCGSPTRKPLFHVRSNSFVSTHERKMNIPQHARTWYRSPRHSNIFSMSIKHFQCGQRNICRYCIKTHLSAAILEITRDASPGADYIGSEILEGKGLGNEVDTSFASAFHQLSLYLW